MNKIIVEKYNPQWKSEFDKAEKFFERVLQGLDVEIEHVGSTSVQGLSAKPILDIDIIVKNEDLSRQVISKLEEYEYYHIGDYGIEGREVMKYRDDNPYINWIEHHLYVCLKDSTGVRNHILLRKHLRENPEAVKKYGELKFALSKKFENDIDAYVDGKTKLIISMLAEEGMNSESLENITEVNTLDHHK